MNAQEDLRSVQYAQLCEDYRMYDRFIWQIPSFLVLICSAVIGIAYSAVPDLWARVVLLLIGLSLTIASGIALAKHRFFQATRIDALETLEGDPATRLVRVQRMTDQGTKKPSNLLERRRAGRWLVGVTFFMGAVLFALVVVNVVLAIVDP